jgi:hypothetical protein
MALAAAGLAALAMEFDCSSDDFWVRSVVLTHENFAVKGLRVLKPDLLNSQWQT